METQPIEAIRRALTGAATEPLLRELLCATFARLVERGALTDQDLASILTLGSADGDAPADLPNQARAGGSSRPGDTLRGGRLVDETSEQSFPASDPPSYTGR